MDHRLADDERDKDDAEDRVDHQVLEAVVDELLRLALRDDAQQELADEEDQDGAGGDGDVGHPHALADALPDAVVFAGAVVLRGEDGGGGAKRHQRLDKEALELRGGRVGRGENLAQAVVGEGDDDAAD